MIYFFAIVDEDIHDPCSQFSLYLSRIVGWFVGFIYFWGCGEMYWRCCSYPESYLCWFGHSSDGDGSSCSWLSGLLEHKKMSWQTSFQSFSAGLLKRCHHIVAYINPYLFCPGYGSTSSVELHNGWGRILADCDISFFLAANAATRSLTYFWTEWELNVANVYRG